MKMFHYKTIITLLFEENLYIKDMKELVLFSFRDCVQQNVRDIFVCVHKVSSFSVMNSKRFPQP